jgi:hypothetical protein
MTSGILGNDLWDTRNPKERTNVTPMRSCGYRERRRRRRVTANVPGPIGPS